MFSLPLPKVIRQRVKILEKKIKLKSLTVFVQMIKAGGRPRNPDAG
jgi:hypothetical protein